MPKYGSAEPIDETFEPIRRALEGVDTERYARHAGPIWYFRGAHEGPTPEGLLFLCTAIDALTTQANKSPSFNVTRINAIAAATGLDVNTLPGVGLSPSICHVADDIVGADGPQGAFEHILCPTAVLELTTTVVGGIIGLAICQYLFNRSLINWLVDPTGTVVDLNGQPVANATVTILRRETPSSPFELVAPLSGLIQPTTNPQTTDSSGVFHWDALPGTYEIIAAAPGCTSPTNPRTPFVATAPFDIPPPADNLVITLNCGNAATRPTITGLLSGSTRGAETVEIFGLALANVTSVSFGTHRATAFRVLSPYAIAALAPPGAGTVDITVSGTGGQSATSTHDRYTYATQIPPDSDDPVITAVSPSSGAAAGGTQVTIHGARFDGVSTVTFGGITALAISHVSPTEIVAIAPSSVLACTIDISVSGASGTSQLGPRDRFTYVQ